MNYIEFSRKYFGWMTKYFKKYFEDIKEDLLQSKIGLTIDEYLSVMLSTTVLTFFFETIFLSFIFGFKTKIYEAVLLSFTISSALSLSLFFFFYIYPSTVAKSREKNIDLSLPLSSTYFYALSSGDVRPSEMFKMMSKFKEYGEVSNEASEISRNIEMFGMNPLKAIKKVAETTSSKKLKEFLWGIYTTISSGGSMSDYLKDKSDSLMEDYKNRIIKFSKDLSLYMEVYFTLIISGSIFFIVLSVIMGIISPSPTIVAVQSFIIFILLPLVSILFMIFTKTISPTQ